MVRGIRIHLRLDRSEDDQSNKESSNDVEPTPPSQPAYLRSDSMAEHGHSAPTSVIGRLLIVVTEDH
jgi:hypothetical protein